MTRKSMINYEPKSFSTFVMDDLFTNFDNLLNNAFLTTKDYSKDYPLIYSTGYPKINIKNFEDAFYIEATVPGLTKSDIKVSIKEDDLIIAGEKKKEVDTKKCEMIYKEIKESSFTRVIKLPIKSVEVSKITSKVENGILSIVVPKKEKDELFININID